MKKIFKSLIGGVVLASMAVSSLAVSAANTHTTDPNGNGIIDIADAVYVSGYLHGNYEVSDIYALDFNGDLLVDDYDSLAIQRYLAKMDY
ncbi:MAG: hypothetical protein K2G63_04125 [Oscillospiraceae bacterium]|nr:hypothetical protein [Oscillospiraceae bacterium]